MEFYVNRKDFISVDNSLELWSIHPEQTSPDTRTLRALYSLRPGDSFVQSKAPEMRELRRKLRYVSGFGLNDGYDPFARRPDLVGRRIAAEPGNHEFLITLGTGYRRCLVGVTEGMITPVRVRFQEYKTAGVTSAVVPEQYSAVRFDPSPRPAGASAVGSGYGLSSGWVALKGLSPVSFDMQVDVEPQEPVHARVTEAKPMTMSFFGFGKRDITVRPPP